jgi:RND superfamily putative drug exporter
MNTDPFARLGERLYSLRYAVVPFWIVVCLVMGALFVPKVGAVLKGGGFSTPGSDSEQADSALGTYFHAASSHSALVVFRSSSATVDDASFKDEVTAAEGRIKNLHNVHSVISYYDNHDPGSVSSDKRTTFMIVMLDGSDEDATNTVPKLRDQLASVKLDHWVTGGAPAAYDGSIVAQHDVETAEKLTFPIIIVLLLLVFGTAVSAVLPLLLGAFTVVLTISLVSAIGMKIDTAIFALNVGSMLGLGLAIDYSLIVVTRFREEHALWNDTRRALAVTLATAGRSITYSGITVILAMLVMTVVLWPMMLIRTMSMAVLICAAAGLLMAMTLLPAIMAMLGHRVEWLRVRPRPKARKIGETGVWYRFSAYVMRRPVVWLAGALIVLGILASPLLQLSTAGPSAPAVSESGKGNTVLNQGFAGNKLSPIQIVIETSKSGVWTPSFLAGVRKVTDDLKADARVDDVNSLATALGSLSPTAFDALTPSTLGSAAPAAAAYVNTDGDSNVMIVKVISKYDSRDSRTEALLQSIRADILPKEDAFKSDTIFVGGESATFYDYKVALFTRFPYAVGVVLVMIFLMLMMFFQSLFLPLKAVVLNLLSVAATFGVLVMVFQHGWGSNLLRFDALGYITVISPVMLYVILFALSTDYEVFMLSRVKEHYFTHGDNKEAVAVGLQHTAGVITAAALILIGTFGSFSFGDSLVVKELGVGLAVGVFVDSTLVRVILVPATMALMGNWNWWLPAPIKRILPELSEGTSIALASESQVAPAPAMAAAAPAPATGRALATGPATIRLRSKTLPVVDQVKLQPGQTLRFGRDYGNEIQIVLPAVSRWHARIDYRNGAWWLRDTGSTNGTFVNGSRVPVGAPGVPLHNGDWIMIGGVDDLLVIFEAAGSAPALQEVAPVGVAS